MLQILANEKYIGNNIYNRTSAKLQKPRTANVPDQWVRCNNAYTPIIDPETFARVQQVFHKRDQQYTDEELLQRRRALLHLRGMLSGITIDETEDLPSAATYAQPFGGLTRAYLLIGYKPGRDYAYLEVNRLLRQLLRNQMAGIISELQWAGATVTQDAATDLLTINGQFTASISMARCHGLREHEYRWVIRFDTSRLPDITIAARMMPDQQTIMDYYLFPSMDVVSVKCRLHATNPLDLDVYRTTTLQSSQRRNRGPIRMSAITLIPINEIRVVNPRSRNRISFNAIRQSIASVGLKKPITVHQRDMAEDGTRYNLVCGQGRLEAMHELGETMIPAVIKQAPEDECYLMSLIENLARRPPSTRELLREVKRLTGDGHTPNAIAERLGMDKSYIRGIARLVHSGEDDLIHRVEAGQLPIDTAIKIATGKDEDIQRALTDAYENGTLRGAKLRAVQQLLLRRKGHEATPTKRVLTGEELLRTFEHHTQQQRALVRRSGLITQRLAVLSAGLRQLLADEYFVVLLRAELLDSLPAPLATRIQQGS